MLEQHPDNPLLYRIIHISNLKYVLARGMYTCVHANADPNYINIGDSSLITQRQTHPVGIIPPGGSLGDYIPFYFGPLSPMLYNIKTGYRGITQRPQEDIIYICCPLRSITTKCDEWCFTDGHARNRLTVFYNRLADLNNIDWEIVGKRYWSPIDIDLDRMRRKQAEFLVKNYIPVSCITRIAVYSEIQEFKVKELIAGLNLNIPVAAKPDFYY